MIRGKPGAHSRPRTLFLLRHGHASPTAAGASDHDRALTAAGRRDAEWIGPRIAAHGPGPTLLLCSSARRAVETLAALRPSLSAAAEVEVERDLYLAGADSLLARIREVEPLHAGLLVVGHNPGIGALARALARPGLETAGLERGFPAGALAVLVFACDGWRELTPGRGSLAELTTPPPSSAAR